MSVEWQSAWQSVIHHPLFGIGITLGAYQLVLAGYEKTRWIFLQPVLASMLLVIGVLVSCGLTSDQAKALVATVHARGYRLGLDTAEVVIEP